MAVKQHHVLWIGVAVLALSLALLALNETFLANILDLYGVRGLDRIPYKEVVGWCGVVGLAGGVVILACALALRLAAQRVGEE